MAAALSAFDCDADTHLRVLHFVNILWSSPDLTNWSPRRKYLRRRSPAAEDAYALPLSGVYFADIEHLPAVITDLLRDAGYKMATEVQLMAIGGPELGRGLYWPTVASGNQLSIVSQAPSGSGKTLCFVLGMLSQIIDPSTGKIKDGCPTPSAIVILPTRELATQFIEDPFLQVAVKRLGVRVLKILAGIILTRSCEIDLSRSCPRITDAHIIVGTPGKLRSMLHEAKKGRIHLNLKRVQSLVIDEVQSVLSGARVRRQRYSHAQIRDVSEVVHWLKSANKNVRYLCYSVTFPEQIQKLLDSLLSMAMVPEKNRVFHNATQDAVGQVPPLATEAAMAAVEGTCRMYENEFPSVDDLVVVKVENINEMGANVRLLEYNNVQGMILMTEMSRRRIRSITKLMRVGKQEVLQVLRVDPTRGYIDLSKKAVVEDDIPRAEDKYNQAKEVHSIMRHVSEKSGQTLEQLYELFGWPLYAEHGHCFEAFQLAVADPSTFDQFDIPESTLEILMATIRRRMAPKVLKFRADLEVSCFGIDGVIAVKAALNAGKVAGDEQCPVKIELKASPTFVIRCTCLTKKRGVEVLKNAVKLIEAEIVKYDGGSAKISPGGEPRCVTDFKDMEELAAAAEGGGGGGNSGGDETGISGNIAGLS